MHHGKRFAFPCGAAGRWPFLPLMLLLAGSVPTAWGQDMDMQMDKNGMVMGENRQELPQGCQEIAETRHIKVKVGREHTHESWTMFGYSENKWEVAPCTKVKVTLINDDEIRHQWMIHQMPSYLYPKGMFTLEAEGGHEKSGTFIVSSNDQTHLVHCDMAQHMEKGLKAELIVGQGSSDLPTESGRDLPSIPGVTPPRYMNGG